MICLLLSLSLLLSAAPRPVSLMTDLIERTDIVYAGGYATSLTLDQIDSQEDRFQFAAIATGHPRLGWIVPGEAGNVLQTAYQVRLCRSDGTLVWDSERVESTRSSGVRYPGPLLEPDKVYAWQVRIWTREGESPWSDLKFFKTAHSLRKDAVSVEPLVKTDQRPQEQKNLPDGAVFVDFGRDAFGQLRLTLQSESAQTIVLHLGERIRDGRVDREPFGTCRYRRIELPVRPGTHTYEPEILPDQRNTHGDAVLMPDYIGEVLPFRYLEIESPGALLCEDIVRMYVHHPSGAEGEFASSDEVLNQVWDLCRYTMEATSFIGYHVDGDRERIPYECDALINQLGWYGTERSYTLSRRTVDYLLDHPTWPTEWILQSVLMAWYDYLYTGDTRLLEARYELLARHTLEELRAPNGLVSTRACPQTPEFLRGIRRSEPVRDIVDWPQGNGSFGLPGSSPGEADYFVFSDYNAVVNAYHYATLCCMERIAQALQKPEDADRWGSGAERFKRTYNRLLLDRRSGIYRDGIDVSHSALHSNLFPLAFGLVPEKNIPGVAAFLAGKGTVCSIANAKFLVDALYEAGEADAALRILSSTDTRSWYNAIRAGSTLSMEAWDDRFKPNQDWNHAWGAAPADLLPHRLLGVEALEPGWGRIRIRPQIASLQHVKGRIPTIKGSVGVDITRTGRGLRMALELPGNTLSCVQIPAPKSWKGRILVDGQPVKAVRDGSGRYLELDPLGSGHHLIEVE